MNRKTILTATAAALFGTLALTGCKKDASPPPPPPPAAEPAPAPTTPPPAPAPAVTVTSVDLGNAIGADNKVAAPMTTFGKTDTIHASVATSATDATQPSTGKLAARWTYQDGQLVDELSQDYSFTGTGNTVFKVSNPDGWPLGKYKIEILLDGAVVQTREFEVK